MNINRVLVREVGAAEALRLEVFISLCVMYRKAYGVMPSAEEYAAEFAVNRATYFRKKSELQRVLGESLPELVERIAGATKGAVPPSKVASVRVSS